MTLNKKYLLTSGISEFSPNLTHYCYKYAVLTDGAKYLARVNRNFTLIKFKVL